MKSLSIACHLTAQAQRVLHKGNPQIGTTSNGMGTRFCAERTFHFVAAVYNSKDFKMQSVCRF